MKNENEIVKEFTVKRSTWRRGKSDNNRLRNKSKQHCCLGFLAKECGYTNSDILDKYFISQLTQTQYSGSVHEKLPKLSNQLELTIAQINDASIGDFMNLAPYYLKPIKISSEEIRERTLTKLFKLAGIKVEFV